jgi:hypothetical protein
VSVDEMAGAYSVADFEESVMKTAMLSQFSIREIVAIP